MADNYIYIPETDSWEPVELNEIGLPVQQESNPVESSMEQPEPTEEQVAENESCAEKAKRIPAPIGTISAVFDCESETWVTSPSITTREFYSSFEQEWPSWTQGDNGKWYAPIDPPSEPGPYAWDEIDQKWITKLLSPIPRFTSETQMLPSWVQREDGLWTPPIPVPDEENQYVWIEATLSWITVQEMQERIANANQIRD